MMSEWRGPQRAGGAPASVRRVRELARSGLVERVRTPSFEPEPLQSHKVVVAGPVGVGKTTFVRSISTVRTVDTDAVISGESTVPKRTTTVGIDFGRIAVDDDVLLYLFGTPGQERFDYMWEIASRGMLGFILLADASHPDGYGPASRILEHFRALGPAPHVIALNKWTDPDRDRHNAHVQLGLSDRDRVLLVDARDRASVRQVLVTFLESVLAIVDAA
jgi:uncharacterized protein